MGKAKRLLSKKEEEICFELEAFFALEKIEVNDKFEKESSQREYIRNKISSLSNFALDDKFFHALKENVEVFQAKGEHERLVKLIQGLKSQFEIALCSLDSNLGVHLDKLQLMIPSEEATPKKESLSERKNIEEANLPKNRSIMTNAFHP